MPSQPPLPWLRRVPWICVKRVNVIVKRCEFEYQLRHLVLEKLPTSRFPHVKRTRVLRGLKTVSAPSRCSISNSSPLGPEMNALLPCSDHHVVMVYCHPRQTLSFSRAEALLIKKNFFMTNSSVSNPGAHMEHIATYRSNREASLL